MKRFQAHHDPLQPNITTTNTTTTTTTTSSTLLLLLAPPPAPLLLAKPSTSCPAPPNPHFSTKLRQICLDSKRDSSTFQLRDDTKAQLQIERTKTDAKLTGELLLLQRWWSLLESGTLTYRKAKKTVDAARDKTITNWVSPSHGWPKKGISHSQNLSTITVVVVHNFKALGFFSVCN